MFHIPWHHIWSSYTSVPWQFFICLLYYFVLWFILQVYDYVSKASNMNIFRYKFDDERVSKEDAKKVLEEQYGGEEEVISDFVLLIGLI